MTSAAAKADLARALAAEAIGTGFLVMGVVGSGIMAQHLAHDPAVALLCNTIATGAILTVLILIFAPLSGAHFNPAVTLVFALRRELTPARAAAYAAAQITGGIAGTMLAHAMFGLALGGAGTIARGGAGQWIAEAVATFGLVATILGTRVRGAAVVAPAVGLYIAAAYWFTSSTSFANPAVTVARALTPTYAGIRPIDALPFIAVQLGAALFAAFVCSWLFGMRSPEVGEPAPIGQALSASPVE
jgi:glycerol uptake facilitator-like aquaporin